MQRNLSVVFLIMIINRLIALGVRKSFAAKLLGFLLEKVILRRVVLTNNVWKSERHMELIIVLI